MIKYTKTETTGEVQASESIEFETFYQLLDYLRKDDVNVVGCKDWTTERPEGLQDEVFNGDAHKQKDLLDDEKTKPAKVINDVAC